jgi:FkbM family methyltransferase
VKRALLSAGRLLARSLPDGLPLPILAGPLRGALWLTGAAPGPAKGLSVLIDRCEPGQVRAAWRLAPRGGVAFDLGAHAGLYAMLFARACREVYAFEPLPENIGRLTRTLAWNKVRNVRIIPWAAGAATEQGAFRLGEHTSEGKLDAAGDIPVQVAALDDFAERYGVVPGLIKIDVEGAELDVLKGAAGILRSRRPPVLLSTHGDGPKGACLEYLRSMGYAGFEPLDAADPEAAREFAVTASAL